MLKCSRFKLHNQGGQDAHPTRVIKILDMQTRCGLAYQASLITAPNAFNCE
jgi:hypothetical protein